MDNAGTLDVRAEVNTLEVDDQVSALPLNLQHRALPAYRRNPISISSPQEGICMSTGGFMTFIVLAVAMLAAVIVVASCLMLRPSSKE